MNGKINILIVDDNKFQNQGLARLLNECDDFIVRGILNSPEECLERLKHDTHVDIILIDIRFPNSKIDGVALAFRLDNLFSSIPIWQKSTIPKMLFMSVEEGGVVDLSKNIHGFIPKNVAFNDLADTIRQVHRRNAVYYPNIISLDNSKLDLTAREQQVLCKIMIGKSSIEIADELDITKHTVDEHRGNILPKLKKASPLKEIKRITDPRVVQYVMENNICKQ